MNGESENVCVIEVMGERIVLLPCRGAFWPAAGTLLIADVHLGKADALKSVGVPLPTGPMLEDQLRTIEGAMLATGAGRLLVLGDLLHAPIGLTADLVDRVAAWRKGFDFEIALVPGNHDRRIDRVASAWGLRELSAAHREGPFVFTHEPCVHEGAFTWCGHLHPAVTLRSAADSIKLPCFHIRPAMGVLPAFSRFTAGGPVEHRERDRVFAMYGDRVMEVPHPTRRSRGSAAGVG